MPSASGVRCEAAVAVGFGAAGSAPSERSERLERMSEAMTPVVDLQRVSVRYGRQWALRDVSATFPTGAVGLLGPNGAGKSTMIKALLGLLPPDSGEMRVLGLDVRRSPLQIRGRIGYMPENDAHIPRMNAVTFVAYCGELAGLPPADAMQRAHEVLYYVGLGEARYRNVEQYSTGMKQRIKLAQALVHDPSLLFLDEPTNGMDPKGRDEMLELIRDIAHNKQINLILSSAARCRVHVRSRGRSRQGHGRDSRSDRQTQRSWRPYFRVAREGRGGAVSGRHARCRPRLPRDRR
jgi:ABC-type Mn2+/Zn2+ transport system ATPase subunit